MKFISSTLLLALVLGVALSSCKPKGGDGNGPGSGTSSASSSGKSEDSKGNAAGSHASLLSLSQEERDGATPLEAQATIKEELKEGESRVYKIEHDPESHILSVNSNILDKPGDKWEPGKPGYRLFDSQGQPVNDARPAWNDSPAVKKPAGTYYIKTVGPGQLDMKLF